MKFFTVKLKKDIREDSESDNSMEMSFGSEQSIIFEYITEMRLQLDNHSFSAIQKNAKVKSQNPSYLQFLHF